jgi:hypothetical protein
MMICSEIQAEQPLSKNQESKLPSKTQNLSELTKSSKGFRLWRILDFQLNDVHPLNSKQIFQNLKESEI